MIDLNYKIGADGQKTLSATGSTVQSASITTSGFPVQIIVTGDAEPAGSGWHELQIYRDSTAIGEIFHIETTTGGINMTVAMSAIDTPVAGTYTYSVKIYSSSGMSDRYSESGQLSMIVEEKVISSHNSLNWLRRDINPPVTYYGYSHDVNADDTDNNWAIKKVTVSGTVETVKWTNGEYNTISKWSERVASFATPAGSLGLTCSSSGSSLNVSWNQLTGVDNYQVIISSNNIIYSDLGTQLYNNKNFNYSQITKVVTNSGSYAYYHASAGNTYTITLNAVNVAGASSSTVTITA
jgi:hypothetical protein